MPNALAAADLLTVLSGSGDVISMVGFTTVFSINYTLAQVCLIVNEAYVK